MKSAWEGIGDFLIPIPSRPVRTKVRSREMQLEVGRRYRVIHKSPSQKYRRLSVMVYLGRNGDALSFSARPLAGTQVLPVSWVQEISLAPSGYPIKLNERY